MEAEKETGAYEVDWRIVETTEERSVRKSRQAIVKCAHPSSSAGGSSQKKARKELEAEVPLQRASQSGLSPTVSEEEEEAAPPLIQSQHGRDSTNS